MKKFNTKSNEEFANKSVVDRLRQITTKIFELKQLIVDNPNFEELDNQLEKELVTLQSLDEADEYFDEVAKH